MGDVNIFTLAEVAARNGKNGAPAYIVYKDSVYDVTKYLNEHPNGPDVILEQAGKDATAVFEEVGHSSDARVIITKLKVGEIVEEEKRFDSNGKKKKKVVSVPPESVSNRGFCSIITCGLAG